MLIKNILKVMCFLFGIPCVKRITLGSNLCVNDFDFVVISKSGAGQVDILILDTLYKVSPFFLILAVGRCT